MFHDFQMETSPSDFQFLDSGSLTSDMKPVNLKVSEGKCPICWQNNKIRKLIPVYYKMREAIYTCEDPNCLFFITDDFGNLQKFTKTNGSLNCSGNVNILPSDFSRPSAFPESNGTSEPQLTPSRSNEIVDSSSYLDDLFNSEPNNDEVKSLMNELSSFLENNQGTK